MTGEKVSFIVPVYNVEPYLCQCVDSILSQSYSDFECILVDDGSTDGSGRICDEYRKKDARVRVIHKQNGGLSDARNVGLEAASGAWIEFIDSDDWVDAQLLERQWEALKRHSAQIASVTMPQNGDAPSQTEYFGEGTEQMLFCFEEKLCKIGMTGLFGWSAWGKLFDARLLANRRFPYGKLYEDLGFTPYVFFQPCRAVIIDNGMYHYRQREDSIMDRTKKQVSPDIVEMLEKLYEYSKEKDIHSDVVLRFCVNHIYAYFLKEVRRGAAVTEPFFAAARAFLRRNASAIWKDRKIQLIPKLRLAELMLFNRTRLPLRSEK